MFVSFKGNLIGIGKWQWKNLLIFTLVSTVVVVVGRTEGLDHIKVDNLPVTVIGAALGIFVSFRTNAGYDRWWEGRKLWGRMVNASRHFSTQATTYLGGDGASERAQALVYRQIAYVHALRCVLRDQDPWGDKDFLHFSSQGERAAFEGQSSITHALLQRHQDELTALANEGALDELRLQSFDRTVQELLAIQGGCERIKNTPFPGGYGYVASRLVWLYSAMLPICIMEEMGWLTIPTTVVVCAGFSLIGEVGRVLEDPFTMNWPALPLSALSRTIQVNLQQRLGETEVPPMLRPDERGVLM
jgi:ion channel-forming bestrophin family protein